VGELLKLPAAFVALNPRSLEDIYRDIQRLGGIINRAASAARLVAKMRMNIAGIARKAARAKSRPRVYAEAWPNPRISSPPGGANLNERAGGGWGRPGGNR